MQGTRRSVAKLVLVAVVPILSACISRPNMPIGSITIFSGRRYEAAELSFLQQGQTRKSEVVDKLGEPTVWLDSPNVAVYGTISKQAWTSETVWKHDALFLAFDETERVVSWGSSYVPEGTVGATRAVRVPYRGSWVNWAREWARSEGMTVKESALTETGEESQGQGASRIYESAYDSVYNASIAAAKARDLELVESDKNSGRLVFYHGVTLLSWGERIVVFVQAVTPKSTQVEVVSKPILPSAFHPDWQTTLLDEIRAELEK